MSIDNVNQAIADAQTLQLQLVEAQVTMSSNAMTAASGIEAAKATKNAANKLQG